MKRKLPKYVSAYRDRHGKERFVYRKGEVRRQLQGPYNSRAFRESLEAAKLALPRPAEPRFVPGSFDELLSLYYQAPKFLSTSETRQAISRGILESFRTEFGRDLVANCKVRHIEAILVRKKAKRVEGKRTVGGPEAARALHKQLKRLFNHAIKLEWIAVNPAALADSAGGKKGTRHTWSEVEIARYRKHHALGTRARLALEIILWTGQRRADAASFGPSHVKDNRIEWIAAKGEKPMVFPLAPQLKAAIEAMSAVGIRTFLVSEYGKPYTKDGFGNRFREWCIAADLPDECRAHGLRKAIARRAAELEATQQQLKAIGGWEQDTGPERIV
jgi:integrase